MKTWIVFLFVVALQAAPAHAERMILKNPSTALQAHALKTFTFGSDTYVVVEAPKFSALLAASAVEAESVTPDLEVSLPEVFAGVNETDGNMPWHVKEMHYADLPADKDGTGVIVAVLDTGVDYTHTALAEHIWNNEDEIAGNGIDDDNNGYIDDVRGYDFANSDNDPMDDNSHGTHCAGIIAASLDAKSGARGVAPGVKVMPVRIIGDKSVGFLSDAVQAVQYAVDNGATVLSNSWRIYRSWSQFDPSDENIELLRRAIEYANSKGAVFVAAAGNETRNIDTHSDAMFPGGYDNLENLLVVAASTSSNGPANFSNFGAKRVHVAAPGHNILSTVLNNRWTSYSGTSMAAPLVAGAVARGLGGGMEYRAAMANLVTTSAPFASWDNKVSAKGVIKPTAYLAP